MHARTGELFVTSTLGYPSGEGNSLMLRAHGGTIRQGHLDTTIIGNDVPACGGDPENGTKPPPRDCGLKRHPLHLKVRFNGAFENITVRNPLDVFADPLYKNCPNMAPIKSPNLILEFKRKVVGEGMVHQPTDTWGYSIVGEDKQKTETAALTAITRLKWRVLIYRYGQYQWVAGKGDPTPVPPPGGRQAENVAAPTVEQIAGALEGSSPKPAAAKRKTSRRAVKRSRATKARRSQRRATDSAARLGRPTLLAPNGWPLPRG